MSSRAVRQGLCTICTKADKKHRMHHTAPAACSRATSLLNTASKQLTRPTYAVVFGSVRMFDEGSQRASAHITRAPAQDYFTERQPDLGCHVSCNGSLSNIFKTIYMHEQHYVRKRSINRSRRIPRLCRCNTCAYTRLWLVGARNWQLAMLCLDRVA